MAKQTSLIPIIHSSRLAEDVRVAITEMKNALRAGLPPIGRVFNNWENQLPNPGNGCEYYKFDVGAAHPDAVHAPGEGDRGIRRLVVEVNVKAREVREIYFSDSHYARGTFQRVV